MKILHLTALKYSYNSLQPIVVVSVTCMYCCMHTTKNEWLLSPTSIHLSSSVKLEASTVGDCQLGYLNGLLNYYGPRAQHNVTLFH